MSRIMRTLVVAIAATALFGAIASAASAVEAPYWKVGGARLAGNAEVLLKQEGNQVLKSTVATITCTEVKAKTGALLTGSTAGNPGGASGVLEYSNCTWTAGGGEKCVISSVKGAKDKKVVTNALKVELGYALKQEPLVKGNADRAWFSPAEGTTFVTVKSEAETGGKCTFTESAVKGTVAVSVLNSKKEAVAFEEHEVEEEFGFAKALPNASAVCKVAAGAYTSCGSSSLNAFGVAATLEGTSRVELATKGKFGVFNK